MNQYAKEKCKKCVYRAALPDANNCDYILLKGHSRGCPVEGCTRFEEGEKKTMPSLIHRPSI